MKDAPTKADELAELLTLLVNAPSDLKTNGLTLAQIAKLTGWTMSKANERVSDLGGKVGHQKSRKGGVSSTYYFIRVQ